MDNQLILIQISNKLNAFMALLLLKDADKMTTADKVKFLVRFDLNNTDIANIIGTTKGSVEVAKSRALKEKK